MRNLAILAAVAAVLMAAIAGCKGGGTAENPGAEGKYAGVKKNQVCPTKPSDCAEQKIEVRNTKGENKVFFEAVMKDDVATVTKMLKKDKRFLDIRNIKNATPLHVAAKTGKPKCAKALIEAGAKVDAVNDQKRTPLHAAATHNRMDVLKMLVEHGANVSAKSDNLGTPLHDAAIKGNLDAAKYLVAKGADINAATKGGTTPLWAALTRNRKAIAKLLIDKNAKFVDPAQIAKAGNGGGGPLKETFCCENL